MSPPAKPGFAIPQGWMLWAILLLGAALRLFPVWFGLPYLRARPDEDAATFHAMAIRSDFNPHFFHWPSLTFYVFGGLFELVARTRGLLTGAVYITGIEQLLVARTLVALAGTATIFVVFLITRRLADRTTGLLAATFLAVALLHVRDSHFAMTDVLMTLLVTTSLAFLLRAFDIADSGPPVRARAIRWFSAAGLAGGLAASTKYSAAAIVPAMGVAQWLLLWRWRVYTRPRAWRPLMVCAITFSGGFFAATPYAILDHQAFIADVRFDFAHLAGGHAGADLGVGWVYHLTHSLPYGAGFATFAAALLGVPPLARRYGRSGLLILAFTAAFYASIGSGRTVFFRYVLPLIPMICVLAAVGVRSLAAWIATRVPSDREPIAGRTALAVLAVLVAGPALVNSVWLDLLLARTDTRVVAGKWLIPQLKPEHSMHEAGGVFTQLYLDDAPVHRWMYDSAARSFGDSEGRTPDWLIFHQSPLWTYATVPPEIVQLARDRYTLVFKVPGTIALPGEGPPETDTANGLYDLQDAFFLPISGFGSVERPGPTISIYRRRDAPPQAFSVQ